MSRRSWLCRSVRLFDSAWAGVAEELHQYVSYDTAQTKTQGPRRINLNDPDPKGKNPSKDGYTPPESLLIHLSKIDMPELRPRAEVKDPGPELGWVPAPPPTLSSNPFLCKGKGKGKEVKRTEKELGKQSTSATRKPYFNELIHQL